MSARFGPAGNAADFPYKTSEKAPAWIAAQGLDCYEYQCGKGVHIGEESARKIGAAARQAGIVLSLHAPYFINLANPDPAGGDPLRGPDGPHPAAGHGDRPARPECRTGRL